MNTGYRLHSNTVATSVSQGTPAAYYLYAESDGRWCYDGPHHVAAILISCDEVVAPAHVDMSQRRTASGKDYTYRYVDYVERFDQRHLDVDRWDYMPVAFVLLPVDCAEWENIIVPAESLAFSEKAARVIVAHRNAAHETRHG